MTQLFIYQDMAVPVSTGPDPYRQIFEAVRTAEIQGWHPRRLDADDWMTLETAASRMGWSREKLRLWATGERGPGCFPPPLNVCRSTSFYSWYEIQEWQSRFDPKWNATIGEPVLVAMNLALQLRQIMPRLSQPALVLAMASGALEVSDGTRHHFRP